MAKSKCKTLWRTLSKKIQQGQVPAVFCASDGRLSLDGRGSTLPLWLADMIPLDVKDRAVALHLARKQKAEAASKNRVAVRDSKFNAIKDQPGWVLLAGEQTDIVATGTLENVAASLPSVCHTKINPDHGVGCWKIIAPNGLEFQSGSFDSKTFW